MIRKTMLGLGLMGMLSSDANGEDTGKPYADMSLGELTKQTYEKTVNLNDSNFKKEVVDYDGAVIILFDSTCPQAEEWTNLSTNMQKVYLQLVDKFGETKVNNLPLKFASFDGCKYKGNNARTILGLFPLYLHPSKEANFKGRLFTFVSPNLSTSCKYTFCIFVERFVHSSA